MLALSLTALILAGYAASLWWLLRAESRRVLYGLFALAALTLTLRLIAAGRFPEGISADEAMCLYGFHGMLQRGNLFAEGPFFFAALLNLLFQAQLIPLFGAGFWAIRTYPIATGVLATPAAYAVARAFGLRPSSSFAAAAFLAVLPWSIFFGLVSLGGELIFHECLLLAALGRLIWRRGGWAELGIGSFALTLLLYDYWCGRAMPLVVLFAALLARRRQRWLCVAVLGVALIGWTPHLATHPPNVKGYSHYDDFRAPRFVLTLPTRIAQALAALVTPTAGMSSMSPRTAALHPLPILGLAVIGLFCAGWGHAAFLAGGFLLGILPSFLASPHISGDTPTAHRMLMAFPFVPLAAAFALDRIRPQRARLVVTAIAIVLIGVQSVRLYFSATFQPPDVYASTGFDPERSWLALSIPPPPRPPLIVVPVDPWFMNIPKIADPTIQPLTIENWMPADRGPVLYAFDPSFGMALQQFYLELFGGSRVRIHGRAFLVSLEENDWSWLEQHGWALEARCGDDVRRGQVPVLYQWWWNFRDFRCSREATYRWRGQWRGGAAELTLHFSGRAQVVSAGHVVAEGAGDAAVLRFNVAAETLLEVSVATPRPVEVSLLAPDDHGERLPRWDAVTPAWEPPLTDPLPDE